MPARVVLLLRRVDVHRVDGAARTTGPFLPAGTILRFALRQLGRHLGVRRLLSLGSDVLARHRSLRRMWRPDRAASVPVAGGAGVVPSAPLVIPSERSESRNLSQGARMRFLAPLGMTGRELS